MSAIQPCALLLLVGPDWQVEAVSANVAMLGDYRPASVVGQPLGGLIGSKAIHNLRNRMAWLASDESEVQDFGVQWGDGHELDSLSFSETHFLKALSRRLRPDKPRYDRRLARLKISQGSRRHHWIINPDG